MESIDWTTWSAIAEIVGSIAIIVTLVYLVFQTRQNTDALLATMRQSALETEINFILENANRPAALAALGLPFPVNPASRDEKEAFEEAVQMAAVLFRIRESQWLNFRAGVLDQSVWEPYRTTFLSLLEVSEVMRIAWEHYAPMMTPGFREEIDNLRDH